MIAATFTSSLFNVGPRLPMRLDPGFRPLILGVRNYRESLAAFGSQERIAIGLEQNEDRVARLDLNVFPSHAGRKDDNVRYVSWMLNFLLWSRGGWRVTLGGPQELCQRVAAQYAPGGSHAFDGELMSQAFLRPFVVDIVDPAEVPQDRHRALRLGGHLDGCRIGFDLGASDFKVAAVRDGEPVYSEEFPWSPRHEADPAYHFSCLNEGLKKAASHLPRVDAIGGSSAGILVNNEVRVASLFRAVPKALFDTQVRTIFSRLQAEWRVPVEVINDGDVTALAGALSLGQNGILGIAMGSSEAVGFLDRSGNITGWLNELAFAPVDANPTAGTDDWSGHPGVGAAYFSQQAVSRLAGAAEMTFPEDMALPERLREVQVLLERGEPAAAEVFDSIGTVLGYTLPWYAEFYDLNHVLILGRVTSGSGGERILARAKAVLTTEFPELASRLSVSLPDEKSRRVGQAVAAASLPPGARS